MQNKYNKIMIKKYMEKIILNIKMSATLATTSIEVGGGYHTLSFTKLFHILRYCVFTPLLRFIIAMNKQYMTNRQCVLLNSPFDNRILSCNRAVKT